MVEGSAFAIAFGSIPKKTAPRSVPVAKLIRQNIILWVHLSRNKRRTLPIRDPTLPIRLNMMIQMSNIAISLVTVSVLRVRNF
jgi:hypothetical protein